MVGITGPEGGDRPGGWVKGGDGALAGAHPANVVGQVLKGLLRRAGIRSSGVGQVGGGCSNRVGAQAMNVTRTAWLAHDGDEDVACITVDSQCGSSQQATNLAHSLIAAGVEDVVAEAGLGPAWPGCG